MHSVLNDYSTHVPQLYDVRHGHLHCGCIVITPRHPKSSSSFHGAARRRISRLIVANKCGIAITPVTPTAGRPAPVASVVIVRLEKRGAQRVVPRGHARSERRVLVGNVRVFAWVLRQVE